jgi:hypothetical protein
MKVGFYFILKGQGYSDSAARSKAISIGNRTGYPHGKAGYKPRNSKTFWLGWLIMGSGLLLTILIYSYIFSLSRN